jgi:DNA (cytosine-5)-methyltransferase 1
MATTPRSKAKIPPPSPAVGHLLTARKYLTQADIAAKLGVDIRTVRRWEVRSSEPPPYAAHALQRLLPLQLPDNDEGLFRFADLFAGIGGIRLAFEKLGGKCVYTSEWDAYAQKTYAINFPDGHAIAGDITKVAASDIPEHDVLLAGFPCQPFSIAGVSKKNALGRKHGFLDETQGTLFFDVARIIKARRPRAFLLENVKNLQSHDGGRTFATICKVLRDELKYDIHCKVVDGAHFVPQHRERILIAGFAEPVAFDWNAIPLPARNQRKLKTILHRVDGSEPMLEHDGARFVDHKARRVNAKYTLTDNLWRYLQDYAAKHKAKGNGFGFGLVGPDDVSRTLSARYYKDGSEILIDQGKRKNPRRLTPRECARLMGFPDTYRIPVSDTRAYQLIAGAAVVPMVEYGARLIAAQLPMSQAADAPTEDLAATRSTMTSARWNKDQLKLAFYLYCQLPFGKLHRGNREIVALAKLMGRTPSAVAMKLVNFASLDPAITSSGRKGLGNASALDREVWDEFNADWEGLAVECQKLRQALMAGSATQDSTIDELIVEETQDYTGETKIVIVEQRVKQAFFRRAVLSSYRGRCCLSGIAEPKLLMASHIVPWSKDKANRLNPRNGLCLSALHDRAFDRGLIALTDDFRVCLSDSLKRRREETFIRDVLLPLEGREIEMPERFHPDPAFIAYHRVKLFNNKVTA